MKVGNNAFLIAMTTEFTCSLLKQATLARNIRYVQQETCFLWQLTADRKILLESAG
jgi:hypothetical protein